MQERLVRFRVSTVVAILAIAIGVFLLLEIVWIARQVLTWVLIALFLALALNPLVEWFQRHGVPNRGAATALTSILVLVAFAALGALFIPTLVSEVNGFIDSVPGYVNDVTEGRGPLGRLADRYDLVERVRASVQEGGATRVLGLSGTALGVAKGVLTLIVATVTIVFMTFFMLLEGPAWIERLYAVMPEGSRDRWRDVGRSIYDTIGGYVTGNLLISVIAGVATTILLLILDVSYAVALGLLVAVLDLIPLAGATIAAIIVTTVAGIDQGWVTALIVGIFFIAYQQIENHVLQPVVYSRTVQLSPLAILISVLIGAELAGVIGALAAIPVAGTIQVLIRAWIDARRRNPDAAAKPI